MTRFARWAVLAAILVGTLLVAVTGASAHGHHGESGYGETGYGEKPPHAHHGCMPLPGKDHGERSVIKLPGACRKEAHEDEAKEREAKDREAQERKAHQREAEKTSKAGQVHRSADR